MEKTPTAYEAVIGLEIHAELLTHSKIFCSCPVVDVLTAPPNSAVCPVCAGMPGMLPVVNKAAVGYGLRVALALGCEINQTSYFERKNYFYPDLPKGYQISQYQVPLGEHGRLRIHTSAGTRWVKIKRVHLEEDTGKSIHIDDRGQPYSLVDLNRAGIPLLEIVTEPDLHTPEEVRSYAQELRSVLRYLGVNTGEMQKGVLRIEPNISVKPVGREEFGTRTEVKNLNSFRALEGSVAYEIERQSALLSAGGTVIQQTLGWDEAQLITVPQRSKEEAHDYRYLPEPDLPPLVIDDAWITAEKEALPELPLARDERMVQQYELTPQDAALLTEEKAVADYFEQAVSAGTIPAQRISNWVVGEVFALMNQAGTTISELKIPPAELTALVTSIEKGDINQATGKKVLAEMFKTGETAAQIIQATGAAQISDGDKITRIVDEVLAENPDEVKAYLEGKETLANWFFGQVMRKAKGQANPAVLRQVLDQQLQAKKDT